MNKSEKILNLIHSLDDKERLPLLSELMLFYKNAYYFDFIFNTVCFELGISTHLIKNKTRKQEVVLARHLIIYFARQNSSSSLVTIGEFIGGISHATVLHACKRIEKLARQKPEIADIVRILNQKLKKE